MKSRSLKLLMAALLILQTISFTSVFASEGETQVATSYIVDFTDDGVASPGKPGFRSGCVVKGQYGKAADDASYRFYSVGGTSDDVAISTGGKSIVSLTLNNQNAEAATSGKLYHLGFQFLNEDNLSTLGAEISYVSASDGSKNTATIMSEPRDGSNKVRVYNFNTGSSYRLDYAKLMFGTWVQVDFYFNPDSSGKTTMMINGNQKAVSKSNDHTVSKINSITFTHTATKTNESTWRPTGAQIDNVVFEVVDSVPSTHTNYRHTSESFNFDENGMTISGGKYMLPYYYSSAWRSGVHGVGVAFETGVAESITLETGVFGKPSYDRSVRTAVPADAGNTTNRMTYTPDIEDLKSGEYAHLTFSFAQNTTAAGNNIRMTNAILGGNAGSRNGKSALEVKTDGKIYMFEQDTKIEWKVGKWYKADLVFKIGNGTDTYTKVDGYINGEKCLSDYELIYSDGNYALLNSIGNLVFDNSVGSDYYIDDVAFAVATQSSLRDITAGYSLTSASATDVFVDNDKDIVAITADKAYNATSELFNGNATVYNSNGAILYNGTLDKDCWVKASNGFGGGVSYNVGYKSDKLEIGDITYSDGKLATQAKIGFGIKEDINAADAVVPQAGTIILAIYDGTELVGCQTESYTSLVVAKDIELPAASVDGKTIKAFIFDDMTNATPLIVSKVK